MISDGKKRHYLSVKKLSPLFKGITSNHRKDFYCLNCFHSFRTENKLKKHKNVCKSHDYCYVEMHKEDNKILKYNHGEKSMKVLFIIYADLHSVLEKMNTCHNHPKKSSTTKINKHTTKNKLDYYRRKNCMKYFCLDLKEHATKLINYEKKK